MGVYVDREQIPYRGMLMCHMLADTIEELHRMADRIGLKRKWFQTKTAPHYDICKKKRRLAIACGAEEIDRKKVVELIRHHRKNRRT